MDDPHNFQECSINMDVTSLAKRTLTLAPGNLTLTQPKNMTLFNIIKSVLQKSDHSPTGVQMKITMERKIQSEMMTTYFPSILLMMITYATTFFKPFFFDAALSVNLTTMLVMTTIFISKMEGLPPTSATKMIDYWLILCQLVPFTQVVLLTAMEYLREEEQEEAKDKVEKEEVPAEEDQGPETQEAWQIPKEERSNNSYLPILVAFGKFC